MAAARRYCSATVRLFSEARALWAWRLGVMDPSARIAMANDFANEIKEFKPGFREGRMEVILGLRCRVR